VLSVLQSGLRIGMSLGEAYHRALTFTGRVVLLTGVTLAAAVATWAFSPIKFQADMGILLAFMFVWNMLGALILLPALAHFLLKPRRAPDLGAVLHGSSRAELDTAPAKDQTLAAEAVTIMGGGNDARYPAPESA
jgi:uncharacterized membrane protein YdfJ with MMPL/SSD domain